MLLLRLEFCKSSASFYYVNAESSWFVFDFLCTALHDWTGLRLFSGDIVNRDTGLDTLIWVFSVFPVVSLALATAVARIRDSGTGAFSLQKSHGGLVHEYLFRNHGLQH